MQNVKEEHPLVMSKDVQNVKEEHTTVKSEDKAHPHRRCLLGLPGWKVSVAGRKCQQAITQGSAQLTQLLDSLSFFSFCCFLDWTLFRNSQLGAFAKV